MDRNSVLPTTSPVSPNFSWNWNFLYPLCLCILYSYLGCLLPLSCLRNSFQSETWGTLFVALMYAPERNISSPVLFILHSNPLYNEALKKSLNKWIFHYEELRQLLFESQVPTVDTNQARTITSHSLLESHCSTVSFRTDTWYLLGQKKKEKKKF